MRILYHLPLSPFARKVRLALAEKRIPFELRVERVWERRPEFLEMNAACTVPVLQEPNGLAIADSYAICEYLDEAYPDTGLFGRTLAERAETRRLVAWFDGKFASEVTRNLLFEKQMKRLLGRGNPDASAIRAGYQNLQPHLEYIGWLAETPGLAGRAADQPGGFRRRGASLGAGLYRRRGLVDERGGEGVVCALQVAALLPARCWRNGCSGITPPAHYADLDF